VKSRRVRQNTKRLRRKLRVVSRSFTPKRAWSRGAPKESAGEALPHDDAPPFLMFGDRRTAEQASHAYSAVTSACAAAATGFELCARRTGDEMIGVAARSAASHLRALVEGAVLAAAACGIDATPRSRTCERLRWEWLASTAMVVDGDADYRLFSECARILTEVLDVGRLSAIDEAIGARLRVASAEAYSLARALEHDRRRGELALAHI
jgi:hypothetical protein